MTIVNLRLTARNIKISCVPDSLEGLVVDGLSSVCEQEIFDALELLLEVVAFGLGLCSGLLLLLNEFSSLLDLARQKKVFKL